MDNLMSLCTSCHSTIIAKEGGRWGGVQISTTNQRNSGPRATHTKTGN
ncbi:hypothetical protein [Acetobacterium sp.]